LRRFGIGQAALAVVVCVWLGTLLFIVPGIRFMPHFIIAQQVEQRDGTPAAIATE